MNDVIFEKLPGELTTITAGGSRTASVKLSRPWQPSLPLNPEKCPFCTKPQEEFNVPGIPAGWKVLPDIFTPHRRHRLVVPLTCWDENTLQELGGPVHILEALETARITEIARVIQTGHEDLIEMAIFIHVGSCAGQNLGHPHWHMMEVQTQKPLAFHAMLPETLRVKRFQGMDIFANGAHAGECLIIPHAKPMQFTQEAVAELAIVLAWIVRRGNEKFRSTQGRSPEFTVSVRVSFEGDLRYADYCPILNMWGAPEHVFAPLEGGPITLPWPHEATAAHLRD